MHRFSLQDMVQQTLAEAERREKIAAASPDGKKITEPGAKNTPPTNPATTPERNEQSIEEKTSSAFVDKLASAVEYLNSNFLKVAVGEVLPPPPAVMPTADPAIGAGRGPTSTITNLDTPTPGLQGTETGQATAANIVPKIPPTGVASPGNTNTGTALETNIQDPPGGKEDWTKKDVLKQASAVKKIARVLQIMKKMADVPPEASASEEGVPALPGPAASQERFINSNEAARDYTKRDAKAEPKERMGEVIDEPAQKKSTDPVLQNNLSNTTEAGTKISSAKAQAVTAARALLQKVAEEGASPNASPDQKAKADALAEAFKAKMDEKEKASQGDLGSMFGQPQGAGQSGGGMPLGGGY